MKETNMLFRIAGGIFLLFLAAGYLTIYKANPILLGVLALLAGIGLLAGK